MKLYRKEQLFRIIFYSLFLLFLILVPTIYKSFFMTYRIEMLYFIFPRYVIGEFIGISILVCWAEYYFFVKKKIEIKNKELRKIISCGIILFLICFSKLFVL